MAKPFTIYKLTILYMLSRSDEPITNIQISCFFLDWDYAGYFRVQEALQDLQDSGLITADVTPQGTSYSVTDSGRDALFLLRDKMNPEIEDDVTDFLAERKVTLRKKNAFTAEYSKLPGAGYDVHMRFLSEGHPIIDLTLFARTKKQAETMCDNWRKQCDEVYANLMDTLLG